jgi:glycosyltransferase involved in cell wall biosynthesis
MLISIIIVTKNQCEKLENVLKSISIQTFKNYEIIVIDGKSTDKTLEIINKYKINKWVSEIDKGPYNAMNKAINFAEASYLYFLGSDDQIYNKNTLKSISKILENNINNKVIINFKVIINNKIYPVNEINEKNLLDGIKLNHQGVFMNREEIIALKGFDENFKIAADQDLFIRATLQKNKLINYKNIVAVYGVGGLSSKGSLLETIKILTKNKLYIRCIKFFLKEYLRKILININILK